MKKPCTTIGNSRGQLSIFLAISLMIVTTLLAFIVNVGLFVRAKINLQNAVDAAAYAGAAVQARQLTNIAYLNWEMRNNYKEWMFKYYVLGQLGLRDLRNNPTSDRAHFRMKPFFPNPTTEPNVFDRFNLPSICIHFGSESNVCEIFQIPGLPRFDTVDTGIPGIVEHHKAFLDSIVATKANDCSVRSDLNFSTAVTWAYGTKRAISQNVPLIASDRTGAWVNAIELAIRMRNLESIVNRPPIPQPICFGGSNCLDVTQLNSESENIPMNERPIKAFWSAYRNLGGGSNKRGLSIARNFKLTEVAPNPVTVGENTLSSFLIPASAIIGQSGVTARTKHYLDLRAYPINLVTFFTTFVSNTGEATVGGVAAEAACGGSKTALPIPGFITGFVKNPELLTYYAVKGETEFVGLFFPFTHRNGIKLQTYAAAKPYGGRIGPRLFNDGADFSITPRVENSQMRSAPYVAGLNVSTIGTYRPGLPIPLANNFWVNNEGDVIGGVPQASMPRYAIPNLMYDFETADDLNRQTGGGKLIQVVGPATNKSGAMANSTGERLGLYDNRQYQLFLSTLTDDSGVNGALSSSGQAITNEMIQKAIFRARRPTRYEALNYLIPHIHRNGDNLELPDSVTGSPGLIVNPISNHNGETYIYDLFAPLFGPGTIYGSNQQFIIQAVQDYLMSLRSSIDVFSNALKEVADQMVTEYPTAAATLYREIDVSSPGSTCDDLSMAGKLNIFFKTSTGACGMPSLESSINNYFSEEAANNPQYNTYLRASYTTNNSLPNELLLSGYVPGPRQGAAQDGQLLNPINPQANLPRAKRNMYSTKFIPMEKLVTRDCSSGVGTYCASYHENPDIGRFPSDMSPTPPRNLLTSGQLSEFLPLRF